MKKILFIISYFGKFNNYFQMFLNSCGKNESYNWLIITDDKTKYCYPDNVKVIYDTFQNFQNKVQKKFDKIKISLDNPYKLCDFKPAYGYIFEEHVKDFQYWGYCDTDLIFGNIDNCLNLNKLSEYDKIGVLGHFTIFKNSKEIRELFLQDDRYKKVLASSKSFKFDEEFGEDYGMSINNVFQKYDKKIKSLDNFADIYVKCSNFRLIHYDQELKKYNIEKYVKNIFVYDNGVLKRYMSKDSKLIVNEYMYIHLQKRKMNIKIDENSCYKIIPNSFEYLEKKINNINDFNKIKNKNLNLHYFKIRFKNLVIKIRRKMGGK